MVTFAGCVTGGFVVDCAVDLAVDAGALLVVAGFCVVVVVAACFVVVVADSDVVVSDVVVVVVGDVSKLPVASLALSVVVVVSEVVVVVVDCSAVETSSEDLTSFPQAVSEKAAIHTEITAAKSFFFTLFPLFDFVLIDTLYHILHKKSTENCTK